MRAPVLWRYYLTALTVAVIGSTFVELSSSAANIVYAMKSYITSVDWGMKRIEEQKFDVAVDGVSKYVSHRHIRIRTLSSWKTT